MIMQITNLRNEGRTLSQDECYNGLGGEIWNCESGGESDKWGWYFRLIKRHDNYNEVC